MAINMIAIITPVTSIFLSLPKIMGMGPIKITPPVLISLLVLFSSELSEIAVCNMLPMKIKKNPAITKKSTDAYQCVSIYHQFIPLCKLIIIYFFI